MAYSFMVSSSVCITDSVAANLCRLGLHLGMLPDCHLGLNTDLHGLVMSFFGFESSWLAPRDASKLSSRTELRLTLGSTTSIASSVCSSVLGSSSSQGEVEGWTD
nr:hypothetical protein Iba_chr02bCG15820 [Ipomoea batatas]